LYLKRLDIQGFKSFADKINLEFNPGIVAIVGPNGSGKSNISDAVRWVLGEQSAKNLRGTKMEDVIFTGTEHRKPLGFADVSLTIDNSDNALGLGFSEVTVTRRVYRSGESEYFINKTSCRLKDIHQLFMDTGIGKDGYSIIGQGRIDEILSTKSEDRRYIFEEASGIMKYKVRKEETEKKLEQAEQNLERINDIINELENQLGPLSQQAETARKYLALREELKELEVNVYIQNISKFKESLKEYDEQYKILKESIDEENKKIEKLMMESSRKAELLKLKEEKLESSRQMYHEIENNLERSKAEIKINEEKINNLCSNVERLNSEITELKEKIEAYVKEEESKNERLVILNDKYKEYCRNLEEYESKMNDVILKLSENEKHIENLKAKIMNKLDLQSDKRTQINNEKLHIESLKKRQESVNNEINELDLQLENEGAKRKQLQDSVDKAASFLKEANITLSQQSNLKKEEEQKLENARKLQNELKSNLHFKSSRYAMLLEMDKNLEGYNRSVKMILQECQKSQQFSKGIDGALAQLIKVDEKYETALEMALGGALQNIVTDSEEDAKRAIEYLKSNKLGRATFLPVSAVKGKYFDHDTVNALKGFKGFCGVASDLIKYDEKYKGIILNLLGRVVVVDNIDTGIAMARRFGYSFKIVTLDGDVLNAGGSMSGGSTNAKGTGILGRSREIEELGAEIEKLKKDEAQIQEVLQKTIENIDQIGLKITKLQSEIREYELIKMRDENHIAQINDNINRFDAKKKMLMQELTQLDREIKKADVDLEKYEDELLEIESEIAKLKEEVYENQEKHKNEQSIKDKLNNDIMNYKISVSSLQESIDNAKSDIERIQTERSRIVKSSQLKASEVEKCLNDIKSLRETNEGLQIRVKNYEEEKIGKNLEVDRIIEDKRVLQEEIDGINEEINNVNKNIMLLKEDLGRIEVKKARMESEMELVQNRLWDEYELTYNNALLLKKDIGSIAQAQKAINELKSKIRDLGNVNVGAIDEYVKTKERFEFMTAQRDDIVKAKENLKKIISEMTDLMKKQFMEQFKLINENFNIVFRELFDGGRASISLTDEDNVLESGIEIEVQPPGKKLQNMMLLSGGERAFTAIALLFAILRLKPTPFCILDEIEAALDEANVYKFAEYLKKYSSQTQFIIVTHRKGTMECADTLYGVTMEEHGVSKIVSMKMGEKAS